MVQPYIKGHDDLNCPAYSFLVSNGSQNILFDLGARKNLETLAPDIIERAKRGGIVEKNVADILSEDQGVLGIKPRDIQAVILSHHHWDHIGDLTTFPKSTKVVVGPGFKEALLPFYPTRPDSPMLETDVEGREFREIDIAKEGGGLKIGRFDAFDYWNDGSFYLLSTPGHSPGHIGALARVTHDPDTFIFFVGDACHHAGEIRPSEYLPLPLEIIPSPAPGYSACPGSLVQKVQPDNSATRPFYVCKQGFPYDYETCEETLRKIQEFDATDNILVAMAHDKSLEGKVEFYPRKANDWRIRFANITARWTFLNDYGAAIESIAGSEMQSIG